MIPYSKQTQATVAWTNLIFVLITIVWKTYGLHWVPFGLGDAWVNVVLHPEKFFWPRHNRNEAQYLLFHILIYGVGGLVAQLSSLKLVYDTDHKSRHAASSSSVARILFGGFHLSIALYHTLVAFQIVPGKCILLDKPIWADYWWIRPTFQQVYILELVVSANYLCGNSSSPQQQKTSLDVCSFSNFIPMTAFTIMIAFYDFDDEVIAFWLNLMCYCILPGCVLLAEVGRIFWPGNGQDDKRKVD